MRRITVLTAVAALVLAGGFAVARPGTGAQDASPAADLAGHPAVGVWVGTYDGLPPEYIVVHADGTLLRMSPLYGVAVGVWRSTGETTGEYVALAHDVDISSTGVEAGNLTEVGTLEVYETGDTASVSAYLEGYRLDGSVAVGRTYGSADFDRVTFESLVPGATPAA